MNCRKKSSKKSLKKIRWVPECNFGKFRKGTLVNLLDEFLRGTQMFFVRGHPVNTEWNTEESQIKISLVTCWEKLRWIPCRGFSEFLKGTLDNFWKNSGEFLRRALMEIPMRNPDEVKKIHPAQRILLIFLRETWKNSWEVAPDYSSTFLKEHSWILKWMLVGKASLVNSWKKKPLNSWDDLLKTSSVNFLEELQWILKRSFNDFLKVIRIDPEINKNLF